MHHSCKFISFAGLALACAFAVSPVHAEEATTIQTTSVTAVTTSTEATNTVVPTATNQKLQKLLEQHRAMFAKKNMGTSTQASKSDKAGRALGRGLASVDATCVQKAVDTRETALGTSWTALTTSMSTALLARQTALYDAWDIESVEERAVALKKVWKDWNTAHRDMFKTLRTARTTAWSAYKTTMKDECKIVVPKEERLSGDALGSVAL